MFGRNTQTNLLEQLEELQNKKAQTSDISEGLTLLNSQIFVAQKLIKSTLSTSAKLIEEITKHQKNEELLEKLELLTFPQSQQLLQLFEKDLQKIKAEGVKLTDALLGEKQAYAVGKTPDFTQSTQTIQDLAKDYLQETDLGKKLQTNIAVAKTFEHKSWFQKLYKGISHILSFTNYNIITSGIEKIPSTGPVLFSIKHVHPAFDSFVVTKAIPRKFFWFGLVDTSVGSFGTKIAAWGYKKFGSAYFFRDGAYLDAEKHGLSQAVKQAIRILQANNALAFFPEGAAPMDKNVLKHVQPDQDGFLEVQGGILEILGMAQRRVGHTIPIIPIGMRYEKAGRKYTVFFSVGDPIELPGDITRSSLSKHKAVLEREMRKLSKE